MRRFPFARWPFGVSLVGVPALPLAVFFIVFLAAVPGEAMAAVVRHSTAALGAVAVFLALVVMREWPIGVTGSLWAVGTLFAAAVWLTRTRLRPATVPSLDERPDLGEPNDRVWEWQRGHRHAMPPTSAAVLTAARHCFIELQSAWDAGDVDRMRAHTTAEMLDELLQELPNRGPGANRTDVLTLRATLLLLEPVGTRLLATVEFSGMIRESLDDGAQPFREVWMLARFDAAESQWRLARQQALM